MTQLVLRPGQPEEVDRIALYALAGMRVELYPGLRLDRYKLHGVVAALLGGAAGYQQVAMVDDELVGIVAAAQVPMLFFERCEALVVACRATHAGAGRQLLQGLKAWAQDNPAIRRVVWPIEFHAPESTVRLARRLGFKQVAHTCTFEKE